MEKTLLNIQSLEFGYQTALSSPLSFSLKKGEVFAILGGNGQGKTTLLHTIMGMLPPLKGEITCGCHLGYVPQHTPVSFDYRVLDMVLMGLSRQVGYFYIPSKEDEAQARQCLLDVGMSDFSDAIFNRLSGGQQQLVLLARALMGKADCLILDEPTSALDLANSQRVLTILNRLKKQGKAIIFTTHDPYHAQLVADRCLLLLPNKKYTLLCTDEALQAERLQALYHVTLCRQWQDRQRVIFPLFSVSS